MVLTKVKSNMVAPVTATGATTARKIEDRLADVVNVRDFGAKGDGVTDDTAKVQAAFDSGRTIAIPPGTFLCGPLTISTPGQKIVGMGGTLVASAAVTQATLILVTGDRVTLDSVTVDNPSEYKSQIGGKNTGIEIKANNVVVRGCTVRRFLMGIVQAHDGEYLGAVISDNRVLDVLGAGDGPSNTTSTYGEDRGDGITCFGAMSTVTGNLVTCKSGQDARIGIDIEGLETFKVTSPTYSDQITTVAGNAIIGSFRRAIAVEKIDHASVTGNVMAGQTWWGINISRSSNTTVAGNTVLFDRPASNLSGEGWLPERGAVSLYGGMTGVSVTGNVVRVTGAGYGIGFIGPADEVHDSVIIANNSVIGDTAMTEALYLPFAKDLTVSGNTLRKATRRGIYVGVASGLTITSNTVTDCGVEALFANHTDVNAEAVISDNRVRNCPAGFTVPNSVNMTMQGNVLRNISGVAIELFGCDYIAVTGNVVRGSGTAIANAATTATRLIANNLTD